MVHSHIKNNRIDLGICKSTTVLVGYKVLVGYIVLFVYTALE